MPPAPPHIAPPAHSAAARAASGGLVKASRMPAVVPEYKTCLLQEVPSCLPKGSKPSLDTGPPGLTDDAKLLQCDPSEMPSQRGKTDEGSDNQKTQFPYVAKWGVPWKPEEFVEEAVKRGHPYASRNLLPKELAEAVDAHFELEHHHIAQTRADVCKEWLHNIALLEKDEENLKKGLHRETAETLRSKRLLLWKHMLQTSGCSDVNLPEDVAKGFFITGEVEPSGVFPRSLVPAISTVEELRELAGVNAALAFAETKSSGDHQIDTKLWEKTMEEKHRGWIEGPLSFGLDSLSPGQTLTRRFAVVQGTDEDGGPKVRPIDDYSASMVNQTVTSNEKVTLHTLDVVCAMLAYFLSFEDRRSLLVGKSYDLKSAYKQLPLHEAMQDYAHFVLWDPVDKEPKIFRTNRLPFGAVASVLHFLRCSKSLWFLICKMGKVMCTAYFDDFVVFSPPSLQKSAENFVELVFLCTGWTYDRDGSKASDFSTQVQALGAMVDLNEISRGVVKLDNTVKRKRDLDLLMSGVLDKGTVGHVEAQQLRGKLVFADNQVHGRLGPILLKSLNDHIKAEPFSHKISNQLMSSLSRLQERLQEGGAREVRAVWNKTFYVYTDAFYDPPEGDQKACAGLGGVIYDASGEALAWFSRLLTPDEVEPLLRVGQSTLIYELEFMAVTLAWLLWKERLMCSTVIFFIDNNGVRDSCIRGRTENDLAELLLETTLNVEMNAHAIPWYARVPSASNPSDSLSRGCCDGFKPQQRVSVDALFLQLCEQWFSLSGRPMG